MRGVSLRMCCLAGYLACILSDLAETLTAATREGFVAKLRIWPGCGAGGGGCAALVGGGKISFSTGARAGLPRTVSYTPTLSTAEKV